MKRDFLTGLGLESEQVDKIMAEHGKSINSMKEEVDKAKDLQTQIEDYKSQLSERDTQLKELEKKAAGNEELTQQIKEWKEKNELTAQEYQQKLDKQAFDFALERNLAGAKAKNPKAVKALLNMEAIKLDGDKMLGLEEQLKSIKESDEYLFEQESGIGEPSNPPGGDGGGDPNDPQDARNLSDEDFRNKVASEYGLNF